MSNTIHIKIPDELKIKFQKDKHLFITDINKEEKITKIETFLKSDNVVEIARIIDSATEASPYYNVQKEGFYQEFSLWLNFALLELAKAVGININSMLEKADMYATLCYCYDELTKINDIVDTEILIDKIKNLVIEEKEGIDDNPQIKPLCSLFINIGTRNIIPEELADISYQKFLLETNNQITINDKTSNKTFH